MSFILYLLFLFFAWASIKFILSCWECNKILNRIINPEKEQEHKFEKLESEYEYHEYRNLYDANTENHNKEMESSKPDDKHIWNNRPEKESFKINKNIKV
jgi:hypothetical protein